MEATADGPAQRTPGSSPRTYWTDLRFALRAESLDAAAERVEDLIGAAEEIGFRFELGHTTSDAPVDD